MGNTQCYSLLSLSSLWEEKKKKKTDGTSQYEFYQNTVRALLAFLFLHLVGEISVETIYLSMQVSLVIYL